METRARGADATRQRILDAARALFDNASSDLTLDSVAAAAGTSVQTVLRTFDSKERLIVAAVGTFRDDHRSFEVPDSPSEAVTQIFDDYEEIGDRVVHMLAEEHKVAGFANVARLGRENHRLWTETLFAAELRRHRPRTRIEVLTALLVASDVYVWKVLRRDLGLGRPAAEAAMLRLVVGALGTPTKGGT
jgi:AcrR family transcriptional regulator